MKRPSHFMLLFLIVVGTPLFIWSEQLKPAPVPDAKRPQAKLLARGRGDFAAANPATDPRARPGGQEATPREVGIRGPWTLFGTVLREVTPQSERTTQGSQVGLELIPLGQGRHATQALLSAITQTDGNFRWSGLLPGTYRLRALPDRESTSHLPVAVDLELPAIDPDATEQRFRQDVLLPCPRVLQGTLVSKHNEPRSGLTISVAETGLHRGTAVSGQDGLFTIDGVGRGPFEFQIRTQEGTPVLAESVTAGRSDKGRVEVAVVLP